jgi:hypothetical protein
MSNQSNQSNQEISGLQVVGCIAFFVLVLAIGVFGIFAVFMAKSDTAKRVKEQLTVSCNRDQDCLAALDQHFDTCFNENFKPRRGRYRGNTLRVAPFNACLNKKAGKDYFFYEDR